MFEIGIEKILLIMIVVLLLFGAKRIPEIGQSLGKGIREFRRSMSDINRDIVRVTGEEYGITTVTAVSINDTWSALRFRPIDKVGK